MAGERGVSTSSSDTGRPDDCATPFFGKINGERAPDPLTTDTEPWARPRKPVLNGFIFDDALSLSVVLMKSSLASSLELDFGTEAFEGVLPTLPCAVAEVDVAEYIDLSASLEELGDPILVVPALWDRLRSLAFLSMGIGSCEILRKFSSEYSLFVAAS